MSTRIGNRPPTSYVIGSSDLEADTAFLGAFGLQATRLPQIDQASAAHLYGLDAPLTQWSLSPADSMGAVRLVQTPNKAAAIEEFERGGHGIDIYTRDLETTSRLARQLGGQPGPPTAYWVYGKVRVESRILAPSGDFAIFAVETHDRLPSALDDSPTRTVSDVVTLLWFLSQDDTDRDAAFWREEAGMSEYRPRLEFDDAAMTRLMGLGRSARMGCDQFVDPAVSRRFELLYYVGADGRQRANWPLQSGIHALHFVVDDLDDAIASLPSARFGTPTTCDFGSGPARVVAACSPGGVRFELAEQSDADVANTETEI